MRGSLMCLLVGSLLLAGCGGDDKDRTAGMKKEKKGKAKDRAEKKDRAEAEVAAGVDDEVREPQKEKKAQPRKIISSPTWSGLESEHVSYNAGYTNVHELIPWRTLSGATTGSRPRGWPWQWRPPRSSPRSSSSRRATGRSR